MSRTYHLVFNYNVLLRASRLAAISEDWHIVQKNYEAPALYAVNPQCPAIGLGHNAF